MITPISNNNIKAYSPYFTGMARVYEVKPSNDKIIDKMFEEYMTQLDEKHAQTQVAKKYIINQKEILEKNKEETKRVLGILYQTMGKVCKRQRHAETPDTKWRPSMGSYEAEKYTKNSELKQTLYRTSISPKHHTKNGFRLEDIDMHYPGIYFAQTQEDAQMRNGFPLRAKVNVENIQNYNTFLNKEKEIIEHETRNPEVKDALYSTIGVLGNVLAREFNIDAFEDKKEYFDGLKQVTYYSVVDPKNIVVLSW